MSLMAKKVLSTLNGLFPANPHKRVFSEYSVRYKGQQLFFDFYIKEYLLLVECQGGQHFKFVKHFHNDKAGFDGQKYRDNLKIEYIQKNNFYLIYINHGEEVTRDLILCKIDKAFDSEYNICF